MQGGDSDLTTGALECELNPKRQVHWRFAQDLGHWTLSHGHFRLVSVAESQFLSVTNVPITVEPVPVTNNCSVTSYKSRSLSGIRTQLLWPTTEIWKNPNNWLPSDDSCVFCLTLDKIHKSQTRTQTEESNLSQNGFVNTIIFSQYIYCSLLGWSRVHVSMYKLGHTLVSLKEHLSCKNEYFVQKQWA